LTRGSARSLWGKGHFKLTGRQGRVEQGDIEMSGLARRNNRIGGLSYFGGNGFSGLVEKTDPQWGCLNRLVFQITQDARYGKGGVAVL
jgi:hypothetical protein